MENTNEKVGKNGKPLLVKVGCLWKRDAKSGTKYLKGVINFKELGFDKDVQILGFSNKKDKDTQPDINLYLSEDKPAAAPVPKAPVATKKVAVPVEAAPPEAPGDNELL